jgi:SAM-dependent methyltransferase
MTDELPNRSALLTEEVRDLRIAVAQLTDVVRQLGGAAPPPKHLQVRVVGAYREDFMRAGEELADDIDRALAPFSVTLRSFPTILDFGCGCGRLLTAVAGRLRGDQRLFGGDIDAEAVAWCQTQYARVATVSVLPTSPPTAFADHQFALVYGISVLTHLPEPMQFDWLRELQRITRPGGYLVLSVHGKNHFQHFPAHEIERDGFSYADLGHTDGLPTFYRTAAHTESYIRRRWTDYLDVLALVELGIHGRQDAVVCRRRDD